MARRLDFLPETGCSIPADIGIFSGYSPNDDDKALDTVPMSVLTDSNNSELHVPHGDIAEQETPGASWQCQSCSFRTELITSFFTAGTFIGIFVPSALNNHPTRHDRKVRLSAYRIKYLRFAFI